MLVVDIQLRDKVSRRGRREIALACSSCVLINLVIQTLTPSRHEIVCLLLSSILMFGCLGVVGTKY